ncbi:MAG: sugar-binding protein, partial [Armatimonadota bacterium]|nr:sugar-binding protein [Armatimonadota bacterium]
PIPKVQVPKLSTPPLIDGKLDDPAWQLGAKAKIEYTNLGKEVTQPTEVMLGYDANCFYIAFRCFEPKLKVMSTKAKEPDGLVFQDDSVEVFIGLDKKDYAHFVVNAEGIRYDAKVYDVSWNPEWKAATGKESVAWVVELSIPFNSLRKIFDAGQVWRANFCRNRVLIYKEAETMCWSPTYGSLHNPKRFGEIVFKF